MLTISLTLCHDQGNIILGRKISDFYNQQDRKIQKKIDHVLWLIRYTEQVPAKFLKYLEDSDGIYEVRISTVFREIRILCFFDANALVVLVNCFLKKSRKTPMSEIRTAERLKKDYFENKKRSLKK